MTHILISPEGAQFSFFILALRAARPRCSEAGPKTGPSALAIGLGLFITTIERNSISCHLIHPWPLMEVLECNVMACVAKVIRKIPQANQWPFILLGGCSRHPASHVVGLYSLLKNADWQLKPDRTEARRPTVSCSYIAFVPHHSLNHSDGRRCC